MQIDPKRLKTLRQRERLSREGLASKAKISQRQITRLENETTSGISPRDHTVNQLAKALDVEPGVLTGETSMPAAGPRAHGHDGSPRQISARVHAGIGLAYALIKNRYGVGPTTLVNAAPLMFVLLAEGSFVWRRERLKQLDEAVERLRRSGASHLLSTHVGVGRAEEGAFVESKSIEGRDLFGEDVLQFLREERGYTSDDTNPFAAYLSDLAAKIDDSDIVDVSSKDLGYGALENFPYFTICNGDVDSFTGGSDRLNLALRLGYLRVDDVPEDLLSDAAGERRQLWLKQRLKELPEKAKELLAEISSLDLDSSESEEDEADS